MFELGRRLRRLMLVCPVAAAIGVTPAVARADPLLAEFNQPTGYDASQPVAGPDGDVWFLNNGAGVGAVSPSGAFAQIDFGTPMVSLFGSIATGAGDSLWVGDYGLHAIWRVLPDAPAGQQVTELTTGLLPGASPQLLTLGPDGDIWFYDASQRQIGRITPAGAITMFTGLDNTSELNAMTVGPDGNLWFTDQGEGDVGYVTMSGQITEIPVGGMPDDITAGPDGNVWFTNTDSIEKINPATHAVTSYSAGLQTGAVPDVIIAGPDGNVWFDDQYAGDYAVGRITPAGTITEYPLGDGLPVDLTAGLDGNIWVAQGAGTNQTTAPAAVERVIPAPVLSAADVHRFSTGLHPGGIQDGDEIITGPDGSLWFTDSVAPRGIGKVSLQIAPAVSTGAASAITGSTATIAGTVNPLGSATTVTVQYGISAALGEASAAVTLPAAGSASGVSLALSGLPAGTTIYYRVAATSVGGTATGATDTFTTSAPPATPVRTLVARLGDRRLRLTTPARAMCQARRGRYSVSLTAEKLRTGRRARFVSASFSLDRGVRHTQREKRKVRVGGTTRIRTVTVVTYTANATARRLPATEKLSLGHLAAGTHTLTVKVMFHETRTQRVRRHGRRVKVTRTVTVTRTLRARFAIC